MMNALWGYGEHMRREAVAGIEARQAASDRRMTETIAADLERRLDKLTLISMAMWSFLKEKSKLTEEDLLERVKTIDLMDGSADGKLKRQIAQCPSCNRVMSPRHMKCLYCGGERLNLTGFDDVI
jgi:hypothetical protein